MANLVSTQVLEVARVDSGEDAIALGASPRISSLEISSAEDNGKLIELWLRNKADSTKETYQRDVNWFLAFVGEKPLNLITIEDLHNFHQALKDRGLAYSTQRRRLMAVKSLLSYGHRIGVLAVDCGKPFELAAPAKTLHKRIMSEGETLRMIHGFKGRRRDYLILLMLYATAARAAELCALKWGDITERADGAATVAITGKGDKTRYVVIPASVWAELKPYGEGISHTAPLFPSRTGRHLVRSQINRIVTNAKQQAGINKNVSPHWFRHAHASHALQKKAPVKLVKETLGHASLDTTDQYLHVSPDESSGLYLAL